MADERLRIKIEADAKRAERDLKNIADLADELTGDDLTILVNAKAEAAEAEIRNLTKLLAQAEDPVDIKVITTGLAQARQQLDDLGKAGGGARKNMDDLGKSADSSKSVFANMVGNATQDLGALGGVAGSAGVAIGQMGEYMADARADGDSFGKILKNFGAVAGPIALLSVGVGLVTGAMNEMKKRAEESAKRTAAFGDAMKTAADDSVGFASVLADNSAALEDFRVLGEDATGSFGVFVDEMGSKLPLVGKFFKESSVDIIDASRRAGISVFDLSQEVENGAGVSEEFAARLQHAADAGLITGKEMEHVADAVGDYGKEAEAAAKKQNLFNVNQESANALLQEAVTKDEPLKKYTNLWNRLFDDMADGTIDTNSTANAINLLADKLGLTQQEVIDLARADLAGQLEAQDEAARDAAEAMSEYKDVVGSTDFGATAMQAANTAFGDFTDQQFEAGNLLQEQAEAWGALSEAVKDGGLNLDTTTEKGAAQQDALEDLARTIDTQLATAYVNAAGDGNTFKASAEGIANSLRTKLRTELDLSDTQIDEVITSLGLMPDQVETRYNLAGTEDAQLKLGLLQGAIDALPDDVKTTVTQQIISGDYAGALKTVQDYYNRHYAYMYVGLRYQGGGSGVVEPPIPPDSLSATATTMGAPPAASTTMASSSWMSSVDAQIARIESRTIHVKVIPEFAELRRHPFGMYATRATAAANVRNEYRNGTG